MSTDTQVHPWPPLDAVCEPLFFDAVSSVPATKAKQLETSRCPKAEAVRLVRAWHSRLPNTQDGPWVAAYWATFGGVIYAVALWNNPSARELPNDWLELRRMACAPYAPFNTPSRFLGAMSRHIRATMPGVMKLISYQDTAVHCGTIYKASNWTPEFQTKPQYRDRSCVRVGTNRLYRKDINSADVAASPKVRWALLLREAAS